MITTWTHNGITFNLEMNQVPTEIKDLGYMHPIRLIGQYHRDDLAKLIGLELWGEPVVAVESFAIDNQTNRNVGLLLKTKRW